MDHDSYFNLAFHMGSPFNLGNEVGHYWGRAGYTYDLLPEYGVDNGLLHVGSYSEKKLFLFHARVIPRSRELPESRGTITRNALSRMVEL